jgi:23S rRNA (guanosine2251-2'-O)-methyltransferase
MLVLDGVTDVGNFATLVRSAVAFGVTAIVVPRHGSVALTPTVAKLAAGAIEHVAVTEVVNVVRAIERLRTKGFWIYGSDAQSGIPVAQVVWAERLAIIVGSEGRGMRRLVRENCDVYVRIPMRPGVDSLNVAVAGAIVLAYSWAQQSL